LVFAASAGVALGARSGAVDAGAPFERFVARAASESDRAATSRIEIMIQHWSTDQERDNLVDALLKHGPDALLPAIQKVLKRPAGVVVIPGIPGAGARVRTRQARDVVFARSIETPNGRQVILATDRSLAFGEPTKDWSPDYAFALLDIRFGPDGAGVGKLAPPAKVVYNKETKIIELDNYGAQPVRLTDVRSERPYGGAPERELVVK
jgi:hypothetical protein